MSDRKKPNLKVRKFSQEERQIAVNMYKSGVKVNDISRRMGIPLRTVYIFLHDGGQKMGKRGARLTPIDPQDRDLVKNLNEKGFSPKDIHKDTGITEYFVKRILREEGLLPSD